MTNFFNTKIRLKEPSAIPGFRLTMSFTLIYLLAIVIIPLSGLFVVAGGGGFEKFIQTITDERMIHAYKISFGCAFLAAIINVIFGSILSWVLVRYNFFGKRILDAIVDLPFALPTAVAGITLASIYAPDGWVGKFFNQHDIKIAFTPIGIVISLVFVGLPFVVRAVQPILQDLEKEVEEAAGMLGANRFQIITKIIIPYLTPALLTGFSMAFARALGEYGSVIFIAGNIPFVSEIVPLMIVSKLEQYDYQGASAIAILMLLVSFILLLFINYLQKFNHKKG
jgi:sulfate/thiosulfate transport system permease protein